MEATKTTLDKFAKQYYNEFIKKLVRSYRVYRSLLLIIF